MQFYLGFCLIAILNQLSATAITYRLITENADSALGKFISKVTRFFEHDDILFICLSRCIVSTDVTKPKVIFNLNNQTTDELKSKLDMKHLNTRYIIFADEPNQIETILKPRKKYQSLSTHNEMYTLTRHSNKVEWLFEKLRDLDSDHLHLILYDHQSSDVQLIYGSPRGTIATYLKLNVTYIFLN